MTTRAHFSRGHQYPSNVEGVVVNTNDPQQNGRVQVWCPGLDGDDVDTDTLVWAKMGTPFAGQTHNYPAGSTSTPTKGLLSYGFWSIPQPGAIAIVALLYNDPNQRRVVGFTYPDHGNRSMPVGRNRPDLGDQAPVSDTFSPVEPQTSNLKVQFQGQLSSPQAKSRGAYERQAGQDKDVRDGSEGYQHSPVQNDNALTPQTFAITTPGRHSIIFQDNPENGRVRIKTADGHQIILDDANERIYISTCHGKSWIEMDRDGHVSIYSAASFSVGAAGDLNLSAGGNVNIGGQNVNIAARGSALISACDKASLSGLSTFLESGSNLNILASGTILQTGSTIHLNGPSAASAPCATPASIVPNHEPWDRPPSKLPRGKNWKP